MRAGCVVALVGWLASLAAAAEQEFPYRAYVAADASAIRSGPGRNFYTTEKLPLGEPVEVYRHQDDWCAIRPPPESFSWVRADDLRIGRDGIGLVLVEGAPARIGSRASELRDVIQVRLERGEEVEVLDAVQISNDNGVEFYCKIAPPSGEFRWIHQDEISREAPDMTRQKRDDSDETTREPQASKSDLRAGDDSVERAGHWGSWVRSRRTDMGAGEGLAPHSESTELTSDTRSSRATESTAGTAPGDSRDSGGRRTVRRGDQAALAAELRAIDRELSRIIVEEPAIWNLDDVRRRAEAASEQATQADDRDAVADLQERIARFDDIRQRSLALASPSSGTAHRAREALGVDDSAGADDAPLDASSRGAESQPRDYDGVGKLTRVVSQRPGAPRYALVNSSNEVVSFVSPAAGVNLQSYEGQHVGISGQRGYMPELKKPHVTALRVNALDIDMSRLANRPPWRDRIPATSQRRGMRR